MMPGNGHPYRNSTMPAQFFVLRHICGKFACVCCQTIAAAPMPAQMID